MIRGHATETNKSQSIRLTPEKLSNDIIKDLGYLDWMKIFKIYISGSILKTL